MKKVYVICPVRKCIEQERQEMDAYVGGLIEAGFDVHYPHTAVDQSNDDGGIRICREHREAMYSADEVHIWWNGSVGSHFDLGMAYMLQLVRQEDQVWGAPPETVIKFVGANRIDKVPEKSFQNLLWSLINAGPEQG